MRKRHLALILIFLSGSLALAWQKSKAPPWRGKSRESRDSAEISNDRRWTRVNSKPHLVFSQLAVLCRPVTLRERSEDTSNPHKDKFVTVYVNEVGKDAM